MTEAAHGFDGRRRLWPRIVAITVLVAAVGGAIYWLVQPDTVTATALFQVRTDTPSIVGDQSAQSRGKGNDEIFKKTQVALIKSKFLLTSALRDPAVGGLPVSASVADPVAWLQDHIEVGYPENGEILSISLHGNKSQSDELRQIVDAVAEAYNREVLRNEHELRLRMRDMLESSLQNLNADIKRKYEDYLEISKAMGKSDDNIQVQLTMKRLERADEELAQLEREQLKIETAGDTPESQFIAKRMEQLHKRVAELQKELQKLTERSVDLETRGEELKQKQAIANQLSERLEKLHIDAGAPPRIRQIQPAMIEPAQIARH